MDELDTEKILWCIKNGELNDLKLQLSKTDFPVDDPKLTKNRPAIICAADYGQTEIVKFLIDKGSKVNVLDQHGITALLAAIWENHFKTVELLLKNGADKTLKSPGGNSYIDEAECDKVKELLRN